MIDTTDVIAIDGHDGAGKSTLARWLATKIDGSYQRPFKGKLGIDLLTAARHGNVAKVIDLGNEGIENALAAAGPIRPVVLDRAWMTVASLVDWEVFVAAWNYWVPTVLCWADLSTTLDRLGRRTESPESNDMHVHYLGCYRSISERTGCYVIRTDLSSPSQCQDLLYYWFRGGPSTPRIYS